VLGNLFERRSSAFQNLWASGALAERPSLTGVRVTEETSLRLSAVYASVRLIADTIATLPLDQYIRRDGQRVPFRPRDPWVGRPSLTLPRTTFWQQVMMSLLLDGNAFVHIGRDTVGRIVDLQVLNPTHVTVLANRAGYQVVGYGTLPPQDVLHVTEMLLPGKDRGTSVARSRAGTAGIRVDVLRQRGVPRCSAGDSG